MCWFRVQKVDLDFVHKLGEAFILSGAAINEAFELIRKGIYSHVLKIMQPSKLLYLIYPVKACCKREVLETSF